MTDVIASEWAGRDIRSVIRRDSRNYTRVTQCKANRKKKEDIQFIATTKLHFL